MQTDANYDFEIERILKEIEKVKAKTGCLQFPDGLKPFAESILKELETKSKAKIFLWGESNFGSCDIPKIDVDLLIHFGHTQWN